MEAGAAVPYFEGRDSHLLLQLAPKRVLDALPTLDVATRKGNGAWHLPLRGLPLLRKDRRLLEDEGRDTLKRFSVLPHAAPLPLTLLLPNARGDPAARIGRFEESAARSAGRRVEREVRQDVVLIGC